MSKSNPTSLEGKGPGEGASYFPAIEDIRKAAETIRPVSEVTPLMPNIGYSKAFGANILLKREDLHRIRSYKIRGAYHKALPLPVTV